MVTAHINAKDGDIAEIILLSGDPLRAKYFADQFLKNVKQVNAVRGMLAFTGEYENIRITIMGHGMGLESIGIYAYELFKFYNAKIIIRLGSCGSYSKDINVYDLIIAKEAFTESNFGLGFNYHQNTVSADPELLKIAEKVKNRFENKKNIFVEKINSSMWFYNQNPKYFYPNYLKQGINVSEMESYSLYVIAQYLKKQALTVLTVSDNIPKDEILPAEKREQNLSEMFLFVMEIIKEKIKDEK